MSTPRKAQQTLGSVRAEIADESAELQALNDSPASRAEVRTDLAAHAGNLAAAGRERLRLAVAQASFEGALGEAFSGRPRVPNGPVNFGEILAAVFGPEKLLEALAPFIDEVEDGPDAAGRKARIAACERELERLGHIEETLVEEAEARGEPVARRGDADPAIVLRLKRPA